MASLHHLDRFGMTGERLVARRVPLLPAIMLASKDHRLPECRRSWYQAKGLGLDQMSRFPRYSLPMRSCARNKLWGQGTKGTVLAAILEPGNIHKLTKERKPIEIDLNDGPWAKGLPSKIQIIIAYSETPIADQRELIKWVGEEHVIDERTPVMEKKVPHCPECKSSVEQLGVWRSDTSPLWLVFCATCGCIFGASPPIEGLEKKYERRKSEC